MQVRKTENDPAPTINKEEAPGPVGEPLNPPFTEQPLGTAKEPEKKKKNRTWLYLVVVVVAVLAVIEGVRYVSYSRTHVTTDNAFLSADITMISPQVSASVTKLLVSDNQAVKKGQLLATLDDSTFKANLAQAQANLSAAMAAQQAAMAD